MEAYMKLQQLIANSKNSVPIHQLEQLISQFSFQIARSNTEQVLRIILESQQILPEFMQDINVLKSQMAQNYKPIQHSLKSLDIPGISVEPQLQFLKEYRENMKKIKQLYQGQLKIVTMAKARQQLLQVRDLLQQQSSIQNHYQQILEYSNVLCGTVKIEKIADARGRILRSAREILLSQGSSPPVRQLTIGMMVQLITDHKIDYDDQIADIDIYCGGRIRECVANQVDLNNIYFFDNFLYMYATEENIHCIVAKITHSLNTANITLKDKYFLQQFVNYLLNNRGAVTLEYRPCQFRFTDEVLIRSESHITNSLDIADKQLQYIYRLHDLRFNIVEQNRTALEDVLTKSTINMLNSPIEEQDNYIFKEYQNYLMQQCTHTDTVHELERFVLFMQKKIEILKEHADGLYELSSRDYAFDILSFQLAQDYLECLFLYHNDQRLFRPLMESLVSQLVEVVYRVCGAPDSKQLPQAIGDAVEKLGRQALQPLSPSELVNTQRARVCRILAISDVLCFVKRTSTLVCGDGDPVLGGAARLGCQFVTFALQQFVFAAYEPVCEASQAEPLIMKFANTYRQVMHHGKRAQTGGLLFERFFAELNRQIAQYIGHIGRPSDVRLFLDGLERVRGHVEKLGVEWAAYQSLCFSAQQAIRAAAD